MKPCRLLLASGLILTGAVTAHAGQKEGAPVHQIAEARSLVAERLLVEQGYAQGRTPRRYRDHLVAQLTKELDEAADKARENDPALAAALDDARRPQADGATLQRDVNRLLALEAAAEKTGG